MRQRAFAFGDIFSSLAFWTLIVGIVAYVVKFFWPAFPLGAGEILALVLFILGLIGISPQLGTRAFSDILKSLAFWQMIVGLVAFILRFFVPTFPVDEGTILAVLLFVLALFGIKPELRARGLIE